MKANVGVAPVPVPSPAKSHLYCDIEPSGSNEPEALNCVDVPVTAKYGPAILATDVLLMTTAIRAEPLSWFVRSRQPPFLQK